MKKIRRKAQASVFNLYTFIVVAFLAVVFFGGLIYVQGLITTVMHDAGAPMEANAGQPGYTNMTLAADITFGAVNNSIQSLRMVAVVYIMGLGICIILTNAFMKIHPVFFFVYILLVILGVIFAVPIANAYNTLLSTNIFGGILTTFTGGNWLVQHLPLITLIIGVLGGIFLFINLLRSQNEVIMT